MGILDLFRTKPLPRCERCGEIIREGEFHGTQGGCMFVLAQRMTNIAYAGTRTFFSLSSTADIDAVYRQRDSNMSSMTARILEEVDRLVEKYK